MLVKTTNGQPEQFPYTVGQLRRDNPNTSFPRRIPDSVLATYGVFSVTEDAKPSFDPATQNIARNAMPHQQGDQWIIGWTVSSKTAEEQQAYTDRLAASARSKRDSLLAETDWMALSDVTMSAEMATYRQALRDITDQQGFPSSVTWPTKPE